jgi:hypothetical protein
MRRTEDVETLVLQIVERLPGLKTKPTKYRPFDPEDNGMLGWPGLNRRVYADFQPLELYGLGRVGTVGDGNCLLHSILFLLSPTYRGHDGKSRSAIADEFREVLKARTEELQTLADIAYPDIGGSAGLAESFEILQGDREEINLELAPLIARLYGVNLLAVQINDDMTLRPACVTWKEFDPTRPTILVNYLGGGMDFGNTGFVEGGHYEAILAPAVAASEEPEAAAAGAASGRRYTRKKPSVAKKSSASAAISLNEVTTQYVFMPGAPEIAGILSMFEEGCRPEMSVEAAALQAEINARRNAAAKNLLRRAIQRRRTRRATRRS